MILSQIPKTSKTSASGQAETPYVDSISVNGVTETCRKPMGNTVILPGKLGIDMGFL